MHSVHQGGPAHRGQRTGQGQSGVVVFLVWELVCLQEPLNRRRRQDGLRLARQVRHWSLRNSVKQEREQVSKGGCGQQTAGVRSRSCSRQLA